MMEILDLMDFQAEMAMRGQMVTWERVFLAPEMLESLISGGDKVAARTQMELQLSMVGELLCSTNK